MSATPTEKPGRGLEFNEVDASMEYTDTDGWAYKTDRDPGFGGLFVLEWDKWDQILLRNSKTKIKRMFKAYYNSRTWNPAEDDNDFGGPGESPGVLVTNEFKEKFKSSPGQNLLPWWRYRMVRTNPFNAKGELCENDD